MPHAAPLVRVTYRMTDQMGVVYYAHYFELFEIGRTEVLRAAGASYRAMEADGLRLPVLHAACDYLHPARYDDLLRVRTWIDRLTRLRIDFTYEIVRDPDGLLLCRGRTEHAFVGEDGRPRRLGDPWVALLERIAGR